MKALWIVVVLFSIVIIGVIIKWPASLLMLVLLAVNYFLLKKLGVIKGKV